MKSLLDAETGQRGYLLTDRNEYLQPYAEAQVETRKMLAWLNEYYGKDPKNRAVMSEVMKETEAKLSELATTIDLHDRGVENGWRELMLSDIGREKMEHVRTLGEQLIELRDGAGRDRPAQRLPDAVAEPHRRLGDGGGEPARALHVPAPDRHARPRPRRRAQRMAGERDRLEPEVAARTAQLKELAQHLQTIREDERSHLARELHDELGALLTAAKLDVARLKSRLGTSATADAAERLAHLNETLNGGIALKRRIIEDLRPSSLSNLGLVAALEILLREFGARSDIAVRSTISSASSSNRPAQLTVYRLVQEALTNVVKYAKATEVVVTLQAPRRRRRARLGARQRRRLRHRRAAPRRTA